MPIFTPPSISPPALILPAPQYGQAPETIVSHGYTYVITGNTLLPPAVIQKAMLPAPTVQDALNKLLKEYRDRGYLLVAIVAKPDGKTVSVNVIQGMITEIHTHNGVRAFFKNVKNRDNLKKHKIIQDNIVASSYAARSGKILHINLSPAPNPGGAILEVSQERQPGYFPVSGGLNFGNYGSRYSSGYVFGGDVIGNLGHGIQLSTNFLKGIPGLRRVSLGSTYYQVGGTASIVTPYGTYGFDISHSHYALGKSTSPLYPDGSTLSYDLTGSQLVYANEATRWNVSEGFHHVKYWENVFSGLYKLSNQRYNYLSVGTDASRGITLGALPGVLAGGVTFNMGISPARGTLVDSDPGAATSHFRYINFNSSYNQGLPRNFNLALTFQGQWSAQTLPAQQQWTLGGFGNMAAWEPGTIVGDSGYVTKLELNSPTLSRLRSKVNLGVFIENGASTYRTAAHGAPPWQSLTDAGLDLTVQLPYQFSARAMAAIPVMRRGFTAAARSNLNVNRMDAFFVVQKGF